MVPLGHIITNSYLLAVILWKEKRKLAKNLRTIFDNVQTWWIRRQEERFKNAWIAPDWIQKKTDGPLLGILQRKNIGSFCQILEKLASKWHWKQRYAIRTDIDCRTHLMYRSLPSPMAQNLQKIAKINSKILYDHPYWLWHHSTMYNDSRLVGKKAGKHVQPIGALVTLRISM